MRRSSAALHVTRPKVALKFARKSQEQAAIRVICVSMFHLPTQWGPTPPLLPSFVRLIRCCSLQWYSMHKATCYDKLLPEISAVFSIIYRGAALLQLLGKYAKQYSTLEAICEN